MAPVRSSAPLIVACEYMHIRLEAETALCDWAEVRLINLRICETLEKQDFAEAILLADPLTLCCDPCDFLE